MSSTAPPPVHFVPEVYTPDSGSLSSVTRSVASTVRLLADAAGRGRGHPTWLLHLASVTPLICGSIGPVVTLLALSGCADEWREHVDADGKVLSEPDPRWVVATTVTALVMGVVANLFMLLRMTGTGPSKWNQNISISLWILECPPPTRKDPG
jgi:hypothetical protein